MSLLDKKYINHFEKTKKRDRKLYISEPVPNFFNGIKKNKIFNFDNLSSILEKESIEQDKDLYIMEKKDPDIIKFNKHQNKWNKKINKLKRTKTDQSNKKANEFIKNVKNKKIFSKINESKRIKLRGKKNKKEKEIKYYTQEEVDKLLEKKEEEVADVLWKEFDIIFNNLRRNYDEIIAGYQERDKHLCSSYIS